MNFEHISQIIMCARRHSGCPTTQDYFISVGFAPENKLADIQTDLI